MMKNLAVAILILAVFAGGCVQSTVDKFRIVGTWVGKNGGKFSFYADGTCEVSGRSGKYEVLEGNRLKFVSKGVLWGENEEVVKYEMLSLNSIRIKASILGIEVSDTFTRQ